VMRWGDGCDLASHERPDASRAPSAKRHCRITPAIRVIIAQFFGKACGDDHPKP
jgi:hypothetical protein